MQTQTKKSAAKAEQAQVASDTRFAGQMEALVQFARAYPGPLEQWGFAPSQTEVMEGAVLAYNRDHQEWLSARGEAVRQQQEVNAAVGDALDFRQELRDAFAILIKHQVPGVPPVRLRRSLGKSPRLCLAWMVDLKTTVAALDAELSAFMVTPQVRFTAVYTRLSNAVVSRKQRASAEVKRLRAAVVASQRSLEGLALLLRFSGRLAFKGQPAMIRQLSTKAGQHHRKPKEATASTSSNEANKETPPSPAAAA